MPIMQSGCQRMTKRYFVGQSMPGFLCLHRRILIPWYVHTPVEFLTISWHCLGKRHELHFCPWEFHILMAARALSGARTGTGLGYFCKSASKSVTLVQESSTARMNFSYSSAHHDTRNGNAVKQMYNDGSCRSGSLVMKASIRMHLYSIDAHRQATRKQHCRRWR